MLGSSTASITYDGYTNYALLLLLLLLLLLPTMQSDTAPLTRDLAEYTILPHCHYTLAVLPLAAPPQLCQVAAHHVLPPAAGRRATRR